MSLFYHIAEALTEANLERALEQTLRVVAQELNLDAAWVWLLDEECHAFYLAASYDLPPYLREPLHMTGEPCWCMQSFFEGAFVSRNVDIITCSRLQDGLEAIGPGATRGLRSHASIALRFGDHALGLLNAARAQQPALTAAELETLATIGAQIGVAVERSRLAERTAAAARIEERVAIARELHDTIVQDLTAMILHLESAERKTLTEPDKARTRIATTLELARKALDELRQSVGGLRNDPLVGESLVRALSRLARRFTSETGIQVMLHRSGSTVRSSGAVERAMYRIASESLTNVRRHSGARRVEIHLEASSERFVLRLRDDGSGFDLSKATLGFGLIGMREHAEVAHGTLHVKSSPGIGSVVEAVFAEEAR
ncbi:MAG TPA: GAF domain-containing sensor histidine kinase [Candidatus Baltobacteraceae bacterium]|jgi:signal transduction histidine kinase|nr:GAF domain-containing sensor histidine kinase [Candidatus Baltobacteraceae bacterium]